jgi:hypothetical protein
MVLLVLVVLVVVVVVVALQFGDQEGLRGMFVALLELLKQKTGIIRGASVAECGTGTANTSLVYHAGRLLALHEGDLPYQVMPLLKKGVLAVMTYAVGMKGPVLCSTNQAEIGKMPLA